MPPVRNWGEEGRRGACRAEGRGRRAEGWLRGRGRAEGRVFLAIVGAQRPSVLQEEMTCKSMGLGYNRPPFFLPAGSRRHVGSFDSPGRAPLPTRTSQAVSAAFPVWAPEPLDQMNVTVTLSLAILSLRVSSPREHSPRGAFLSFSLMPKPGLLYLFLFF